jgi:hypothetical protein
MLVADGDADLVVENTGEPPLAFGGGCYIASQSA